RSELAVKIGQPRMKIDCIHINFYGLYWLLKDAGCNKMCHYFHSRLLEKCKEFGIFFVRKTKYITVDAWVCFRLAPTFVLFLFLFSIHYKIHFNIQQNPDFGGCFKALRQLAEQVVLRHETGFECLKT